MSKNNTAQKNIPQGWKYDELGNFIAEISDGGTPSRSNPSYFGGNIPWIVISDIKREINKTKETLTKEGLNNSSAKIWPVGTVILSFGATIGEVGIASVPVTTKQGIAGIVPKNELLNTYLYYLLLENKNRLKQLASGSTIKEVRPAVIKKQIKVLIPPIPEQQKIAEILGSVDEYILKTQEVIYDTEKLKKGLMQKLFTQGIGHKKFKKTKLGEIPESWEIKKLSSIGEIITGNTPKTSDKNNYGDEFLFVSPKDIGLLKYINDSEKKLSKKGFSLTRKIPKGSVLMVCIGSTIGKIGIAGCELSTNQQINSVAVENHYSSEYIYYQLLYRRKDVIGRRSTQAVPIINKTDFSLTELAVPKTRSEQEEIAEILSAIDEKISINKKLKSKLIQLKKGLAQDLLSGKVRVQIHE